MDSEQFVAGVMSALPQRHSSIARRSAILGTTAGCVVLWLLVLGGSDHIIAVAVELVDQSTVLVGALFP